MLCVLAVLVMLWRAGGAGGARHVSGRRAVCVDSALASAAGSNLMVSRYTTFVQPFALVAIAAGANEGGFRSPG